MPIDPTDLAKSIGALGSLDAGKGLAPTLQQVADSAKQLFGADAAGLMLVDAEGQLRWASASDQTAQTVEDGQERLAQGPCAVAFSQRLPAAIRNIHTEPGWEEFAKVLVRTWPRTSPAANPCRPTLGSWPRDAPSRPRTARPLTTGAGRGTAAGMGIGPKSATATGSPCLQAATPGFPGQVRPERVMIRTMVSEPAASSPTAANRRS